MYFGFTSSFAWFTVISSDICLTFGWVKCMQKKILDEKKLESLTDLARMAPPLMILTYD